MLNVAVVRMGAGRRARATLAEERAAREAAESAAERLRSELDGLRAAQVRPRCACARSAHTRLLSSTVLRPCVSPVQGHAWTLQVL